MNIKDENGENKYSPDDFMFLMISLNGGTTGSEFLSEITSYLSS